MAALSWDEAELGQAAFWASTWASQLDLDALVAAPLELFAGSLRRCYKQAEAEGQLERIPREGTDLDARAMCKRGQKSRPVYAAHASTALSLVRSFLGCG